MLSVQNGGCLRDDRKLDQAELVARLRDHVGPSTTGRYTATIATSNAVCRSSSSAEAPVVAVANRNCSAGALEAHARDLEEQLAIIHQP